MTNPLDFVAVGNELRESMNGPVLAVFSGHWPAVAAMIRLTEPGFRSLGGDREDDLAVEAQL